MTSNVPSADVLSDKILLSLARELALDIKPLETVLKEYKIGPSEYDRLLKSARFRMYLDQEVAVWQTSVATPDRVRIKSAAVLEEWLPELYQRMNDPKEALSAKVEAGKLLAKMADIGTPKPGEAGSGERFSVTINLGADQSLTFEKTVTPRVIDAREDD